MTIAERPAAMGPQAARQGAVVREVQRRSRPLLDAAMQRQGETLVSVCVAIAPLDLVALFDAAQRQERQPSLWRQPAAGFALLAIDVAARMQGSGADRITAVETAWSALCSDALVDMGQGGVATGPLLIGGLSFSDAATRSDAWGGFEAADLILPRLLVTETRTGSWLTVSVVMPAADASSARSAEAVIEAAMVAWQDLVRAAVAWSATEGAEDTLRITDHRPAAPEWRASVARLAGAVGRGRVDKVVLARQVDVLGLRALDVAGLIGRLEQSAPDSTIFAITRGRRTFVGATPERLVRLDGRDFRTVALAGSTRRAHDADGDARLAAALLRSDKEREEHAVVVRMLRDTLTPLATDLSIPEAPSVRRLRHVQHLATEVSGTLREPMGILSLVARLHPTPAVGGAPRELALELIDEEEGQDRGWYASPVGWLDRHADGEFVVALRCGLIDGPRATLFAGCGIVADSDPDREWDESLIKLRAFGSALGQIES